jgi:hypothetical protein
MVFLAGTAYVFCTGSVVSAAPPASSRRTGNRRCLITSAMRDLPLRLRITNALGGAGTYFKRHDGETIWDAIQRQASGWFEPAGTNPFHQSQQGKR